MHPSTSRSALGSPTIVGAGVLLLSLLLSANLVMGQPSPNRRVIYTSHLAAPAGATPADFAPPPTTYDYVAAERALYDRLSAAMDRALAEAPAPPWNANGLSRTAIDPTAMRFDESRGRWVADLEGGAIAVLTLEPSLQRRARQIVSVAERPDPGKAVVLLEAATGRVLAMADGGGNPAIGGGLARRATAYAASTFKVITAAALLSEGVATLDTQVCYDGGGSGMTCDGLAATTGGTCRGMRESMAHSTNYYFGRLAYQHLEPEALLQTSQRFGFNSRIPFELPLERSRVVIPESRCEYGRMAAGFRSTWMTPLHGAMIQGAIANGGVMMVPTIVDWIEDAGGAVVYRHTPTPWRTAVSETRARQLRDVQRDTCTAGTARTNFASWTGATVWGKTGTLMNRDYEGHNPDPAFLHRWFTGAVEHPAGAIAGSGLSINDPNTWWDIGSSYAAAALQAAASWAPSAP